MVSLKKRRAGQPTQVVALADKAMHRLNRRFVRLLARGKAKPKVAVAIARELTGSIWAAMRLAPPKSLFHPSFHLQPSLEVEVDG